MAKETTQNVRFCAKRVGDFYLIMSFPEDFASDADKGASFFDGKRIVVGHSHGYFLE